MGGVSGGRAQVIDSKGCSRLLVTMTTSFPFSSFRARGVGGGAAIQSSDTTSPALSSSSSVSFQSIGPFSGLVICVTGLSKEARKQVMDATQRLGGQYSPHLHPKCTHLVVQSFYGRKFEHGLKHGKKNGLVVVTLGWFVDSVRRNVRLRESLYNVQNIGENGIHGDDLRPCQFTGVENSCLPISILENVKQSGMMEGSAAHTSEKESNRSLASTLAGHRIYIDPSNSTDLRTKVVEAANREGAAIVDQWFIGCGASLIVCEGPSVQKYLGHSSNLVTPLWILKTARENRLGRLVHISADLARQVGTMLEDVQHTTCPRDSNGNLSSPDKRTSKCLRSHEERQMAVDLAKIGIRKRRAFCMQSCQTPMRLITPSSLLDSICWSVSEPTSTAAIYSYLSSAEDASEHRTIFFESKGDEKDTEASFMNFTRPLTESEKTELIFKNPFLTILFPVDRYSEMGPCSRTFFSETGFTCLQVLDLIYAFYQETMSTQEIEIAIYTDSRHADRLRSAYSSKDAETNDFVEFKRIDFLGSRKSFEMLKRIAGDNSSNVYELIIRA